jgi:hypothetical protein
LIDESVIVGSANLDNAYGGEKYGTSKFQDLNIFLYGTCVQEAKEIF